MNKNWVFGALGIVVVCASLPLCGREAKHTSVSNVETKQIQQLEPQSKPIDIVAADLVYDYEQNQFRGEQKWNGKFVNVSGLAGGVQDDGWGPTIAVCSRGTNKKTECILCFLNKNQREVASNIKTLQPVTLYGRVDGWYKAVHVRQCEFK